MLQHLAGSFCATGGCQNAGMGHLRRDLVLGQHEAADRHAGHLALVRPGLAHGQAAVAVAAPRQDAHEQQHILLLVLSTLQCKPKSWVASCVRSSPGLLAVAELCQLPSCTR